MKTLVLLFGLVLIVSSCAAHTTTKTIWNKPGLTQQEFNKDSYDCVQESKTSWGGGGVGPIGLGIMIGSHVRAKKQAENLYKMCMQARGYTFREVEVPTEQSNTASTSPPFFSSSSTTAENTKMYFKKALELANKIIPAPFSCRTGHVPNQRLFVYAIAPWAEQAGLRRGDKITAIDDSVIIDLQEYFNALAKIPTGGPLQVSVDRAGQPLSFTLPCRDGRNAWTKGRQILTAGIEGRWDECISASLDLELENGFNSYGMLNIKFRCMQAKLRAPGRPYTPDEANLLYQTMTVLFEESQFEPGALDRNRGTILTNATVLRRNGFSTLADDLERRLTEKTSDTTTPSKKTAY